MKWQLGSLQNQKYKSSVQIEDLNSKVEELKHQDKQKSDLLESNHGKLGMFMLCLMHTCSRSDDWLSFAFGVYLCGKQFYTELQDPKP